MASTIAGVTLQIVRDWVLRFNEGGPDGLATRKVPGRASILNDEQRARLTEIVETGPIPAAHGIVRWRLADLAQWIWDEFELSVTRHTLGRELRAMGYRKLSARPRHRGQQPDDIVDFKEASPKRYVGQRPAAPCTAVRKRLDPAYLRLAHQKRDFLRQRPLDAAIESTRHAS